ncbi:MAG: rhodanese-like domain-containing protein [Pseudomonadota bacterium]
MLVDVRTLAEWTFVGVPDLSVLGRDAVFVEWQDWPGMSLNTRFVEDLQEALGERDVSVMLFLCRSGVRSMAAAEAVSRACALEGRDVDCINISTGFEGDLNAEKQRGGKAGWKVEGLPWRQP